MMLILLLTCNAEMYFGNYWQSYEIDGAKTPIEWIILDETEDAYLLITKYSLDANIFNYTQYTTWKNSQARKFLNTYFYQNAFSDEERSSILLTRIITPQNPAYPKTKQGPITQDYVFLLSVQEAAKYLENRVALATDFARLGHARVIGDKWAGAHTSSYGATCWYLRTMGKDNFHVAHVETNGFIAYAGDILFAPHYAIRPCIWIKKS